MNEEQLNNIRNDIICDTAILISYKTYKEDNADFEKEIAKAFDHIKKIGIENGFEFKNYDNKVVTLSYGQKGKKHWSSASFGCCSSRY